MPAAWRPPPSRPRGRKRAPIPRTWPTRCCAPGTPRACCTCGSHRRPSRPACARLADRDGIVGTRERLAGIEERRRALTARNESEFAANPARLRANQAAIETDTVRRRAAVKGETDGLYADLRRHLTTGGPNGGPAITLPPAMIMSRLSDAQQDTVTAQIAANIEGRRPSTDPQTWYALHQGLTGNDAGERQRWASAGPLPQAGTSSQLTSNGSEQRKMPIS